MYEVVLASKARKFFESASAALQRRLDRCFDRLKAEPRDQSNIKGLTGRLAGYYRYRLGNYRVIYRIDERAQRVYILRIAHRREAYQ